MIANLAVATGMVATTVIIHFWGLVALTHLLQRGHNRLRLNEGRLRQGSLILFVVFGLFALHTIEIWLYGFLYRALGELPDFERSLYFATETFVSLGYGDIVLSPKWRLVSAIEGANGVLLVAWSTAFLMSLTGRMRLMQHEWL